MSRIILVDELRLTAIIIGMRDQQISPWTFLNDRVETLQPQPSPKANNFTLPKVAKPRESLSKQEQTVNLFLLKSKIPAKSFKTMILSQQHERPPPSSSIPVKKRTEPDMEDPAHLGRKEETIVYLNELRVISKMIHVSLEEEQRMRETRSRFSNNYYFNSLHTMQNHNLSAVKPIQNETIASIRIHEKNPECNLSALRSILKKERGGSHNHKILSKKNRQIQSLKIKLTEKYNNQR